MERKCRGEVSFIIILRALAVENVLCFSVVHGNLLYCQSWYGWDGISSDLHDMMDTVRCDSYMV